MSDFTDSLEETVVAYIADGTQVPTPPSNLAVSLHTSDPGESPDGSTELDSATYPGYGRQALALGDMTGSGGVRANDNPVQFGPAGSDWPTITHYVLWHSNGTPLMHTAFDTSKDVPSGQGLSIDAGNLEIVID